MKVISPVSPQHRPNGVDASWLDLLRGVGVVVMIANHFGYGLLARANIDAPVGGSIVTIGSFAPVLFFLTTGLGVGLHRARLPRFDKVWFKALLLFAADCIMMLVAIRRVGIDFLAFIGISTLACSLLSGKKHAVSIAAIGFVLVATCRFIIGAAVRNSVSLAVSQPLSIVLGIEPVLGFGYPLAPWLCFPLLGFFLIPLVEKLPGRAKLPGANAALFASGTACAVGAYLAAANGSAFVRYGTMSAAYFVAAIGVSLLSILICTELSKIRSATCAALVHFFETRGVACLSVVPVHYLLLEAIKTLGLHDLSSSLFLTVLIPAVPFCLISGRAFEKLARAIVASVPRRTIFAAAVAVFTAALLMCICSVSPLLRMFSLFIGQLAICALLAGIDDWLPKRAPITTKRLPTAVENAT